MAAGLLVLAACLGGAAALRARPAAGACAEALGRLPAAEVQDLVASCASTLPEAVCEAVRNELYRGHGGALGNVMANISIGEICHAVDIAYQGWRRSGAGSAGAAARLNAVSLDQSLQRKAFEWEHKQKEDPAWIDHLVDRLQRRYRTTADSTGFLPDWVRDLSQYVTTSEAPTSSPTGPPPTSIATVTGSIGMAISDLRTFVADATMQQVVRASIANVADVPTAAVSLNMTSPLADSNQTRVDYAIEIPLSSSQEADKVGSEAISTAINAFLDGSVREEVSEYISHAVDAWLGTGIYTISVLDVGRPVLEGIQPVVRSNDTNTSVTNASAMNASATNLSAMNTSATNLSAPNTSAQLLTR